MEIADSAGTKSAVNSRVSDYALLALRLILGGVFIWSSLPKIRNPFAFLSAVYGYEFFGPTTGAVVAIAIPWLELFTGICLLGGICILGASLTGALLTATFVGAQGFALLRHLEISCGCFSPSGSQLISYMSLLKTGGLLALALAMFALEVVPRRAPSK